MACYYTVVSLGVVKYIGTDRSRAWYVYSTLGHASLFGDDTLLASSYPHED